MATQVQFRRGTTGQHSAFTGAVGEVTVDTENEQSVYMMQHKLVAFPY